MSVQSKPLINGQVITARSGNVLTGILMLAFGIPMWILGAKYSLDGWVLGLNILADTLTLPVDIPRATGWWVSIAVVLGAAYSYVEVAVRPKRTMAFTLLLAVILLMFLSHATDVGSTFLAAVSPEPNAWQIARWAADTVWPAALWSLALTYLPEILIIAGIKQFGR